PGRTWSTDIAIRLDDVIEFGIRVSCASLDYATQPVILTRPRIVRDLAEHATLHKSRPISPDPWTIDTVNDLYALDKLLINPKRFLPVIVLTEYTAVRRNDSPACTIDPSVMARRALGFAHVVLLSTAMAEEWTKYLGMQWSVFNGAIRTYYPGLDFDNDSPYLHPLVLRDRVLHWKSNDREQDGYGPEAFSKFLVQKITGRNARERMNWGQLKFYGEVRPRVLEQQRRKSEARLNDLLARTEENRELREHIEETARAQKEELDETRQQVVEWEREATRFCDHATEEEQRRRAVQEENRILRNRISSLEYALEEKTGAAIDDAVAIPASYDEMPAWVRKNLAGRLLLHNRALQGIKQAQYERIDLVYQCLLSLANEYRKMRLDGNCKEHFDARIRELQVEDRPAVGDISAGLNEDAFHVIYPEHSNRKRRLDKHLCRGNAHDSRHTLRVYYFWDEDSGQVVVGWLPGHL
ncbi:MAG: hypothetical protein KFH87_04070, partial [Bacteroidetes bacterium]|nr:hypothetical protein [Bacteroidota bacterium]